MSNITKTLSELDALRAAVGSLIVRLTKNIQGHQINQQILTAKWEYRRALHNAYPATIAKWKEAQ